MYDTCNRCGIGHISSQCPNRDPFTIRTRPSANFANTHAQSSNASVNCHSDTGANSNVTPNLEAMSIQRHIMVMTASSLRLPISSPSSVSHLSPTSPESSNGQPSPVSTTSIQTPPPPTPPPAPPPITRQRPANLCQNPKQRVPYNPSANHATVLPTTITEPTSFTISNNSLE
ncbi:hypothetical protein Tco_0441207 [Tanacetum coccineum]